MNCKGVSYNHCSNNILASYLQIYIPHDTVYCSQACIVYMEQTTPLYRNKYIVVIESTIEVYYDIFKEIYARYKIIKNVVWGVFQKGKKSKDE